MVRGLGQLCGPNDGVNKVLPQQERGQVMSNGHLGVGRRNSNFILDRTNVFGGNTDELDAHSYSL